MRKLLLILVIVLVTVAAVGYFFRDSLMRKSFTPTENVEQPGVILENPSDENNTIEKPTETQNQPTYEIVADRLAIPWDIAFLPNGDVLVTERPGKLLRIGAQKTVIEISGVSHVGEGGLLGIALHPQFNENNFVYLYLTTGASGKLTNRVERSVLKDNTLTDKKIIIENIPGSQYHDGGQLAFGPDGMLYITTGDAGNASGAQDTKILSGKILRLTPDGGIPADNPFGNAVYSFGHRNPQGLTWDNQKRLWATEHGRSGVSSGYDELNLIEKGGNYGWPDIQGTQTASGMKTPVAQSGATITWAPASAAWWDGSIFFGGLRGESLYEVKLNTNGTATVVAHFARTFGRIRAAVVGPDGMVYITTSNTDGRGTPQTNDDKLIKINPAIFR